jgi:hypothetical protein
MSKDELSVTELSFMLFACLICFQFKGFHNPKHTLIQRNGFIYLPFLKEFQPNILKRASNHVTWIFLMNDDFGMATNGPN